MTERFELVADGLVLSLKDNLKNEYLLVFDFEEYEARDVMIQEYLYLKNEMNKLWEQTKRFEKYSQEKSDMLQTVYKEYDEDLSRYEEEIRGLKEENKELLRERLKGHWEYTEGLKNEIQMLEQINKSQDMEIARQHKLLDAMSSKLRELGVHDVYED